MCLLSLIYILDALFTADILNEPIIYIGTGLKEICAKTVMFVTS